MASNKFSIDFGTPDHGWLPLELVYGDFELKLDVSDVPVDPMVQLCDALIQLSKGIQTPDQIIWHLEPYCFYLQLKQSGDLYIVQISESENYEGPQNLIKEFNGSFEAIILPLYRAFKKFCSYGYSKPHWEVLDAQRVGELSALVKNSKIRPV